MKIKYPTMNGGHWGFEIRHIFWVSVLWPSQFIKNV